MATFVLVFSKQTILKGSFFHGKMQKILKFHIVKLIIDSNSIMSLKVLPRLKCCPGISKQKYDSKIKCMHA